MHGMYNIVIFEPDHIHPAWFRHAESRKASWVLSFEPKQLNGN